jgi:hypothetical protein
MTCLPRGRGLRCLGVRVARLQVSDGTGGVQFVNPAIASELRQEKEKKRAEKQARRLQTKGIGFENPIFGPDSGVEMRDLSPPKPKPTPQPKAKAPAQARDAESPSPTPATADVSPPSEPPSMSRSGGGEGADAAPTKARPKPGQATGLGLGRLKGLGLGRLKRGGRQGPSEERPSLAGIELQPTSPGT